MEKETNHVLKDKDRKAFFIIEVSLMELSDNGVIWTF